MVRIVTYKKHGKNHQKNSVPNQPIPNIPQICKIAQPTVKNLLQVLTNQTIRLIFMLICQQYPDCQVHLACLSGLKSIVYCTDVQIGAADFLYQYDPVLYGHG